MLRVGKYKLIEGSPGKHNNWYLPFTDKYVVRDTGKHTQRNLQITQLFDLQGWYF